MAVDKKRKGHSCGWPFLWILQVLLIGQGSSGIRPGIAARMSYKSCSRLCYLHRTAGISPGICCSNSIVGLSWEPVMLSGILPMRLSLALDNAMNSISSTLSSSWPSFVFCFGRVYITMGVPSQIIFVGGSCQQLSFRNVPDIGLMQEMATNSPHC